MRKGDSLDGVASAVTYMEDSGVFNAGRGACLTVDRRVQLDAAVMRGDTRAAAGVGVVTCTYNPVLLARWIAENSTAILVAGEECEPFARGAGLKIAMLKPSAAALEKFETLSRESARGRANAALWKKVQEGSTVGAVGIDGSGTVAAAVSTGGMWLKLPGRIGDSAVIGAGIYADDRLGAACATGTGEEIIRNALSLRAVELMASHEAGASARRAIAIMTRLSGRGTGGIITVDRKGRVGRAFNTEAMGTARFDASRRRVVVEI